MAQDERGHARLGSVDPGQSAELPTAGLGAEASSAIEREIVARQPATVTSKTSAQAILLRELAVLLVLGPGLVLSLFIAAWLRPQLRPVPPDQSTIAASAPTTLQRLQLDTTKLNEIVPLACPDFNEMGRYATVAELREEDRTLLQSAASQLPLLAPQPMQLRWWIDTELSGDACLGPAGRIFATDHSNGYVLDAPGQTRAVWPLGWQVGDLRCTADGAALVVANDRVLSYDASTGQSREICQRDGLQPLLELLPDGHLLISHYDKLFGDPTALQLEVLGTDGTTIRTIAAEGRFQAALSDQQGNIYLGLAGQTAPWFTEWQKYDAQGQLQWSQAVPANVDSSPQFAADGSCYLMEPRASPSILGSAQPAILAAGAVEHQQFDLVKRDPTGYELWREAFRTPGKGSLLQFADGSLVALDGPGLRCFDSKGEVVWETRLEGVDPDLNGLAATLNESLLIVGRFTATEPQGLRGRRALLHVTSAGVQRIYLIPRALPPLARNILLTPDYILWGGQVALDWPQELQSEAPVVDRPAPPGQ